jgi:hypothetical protein
MHTPGYYKTNYRALRFRELWRMQGFFRGIRGFWATRFMQPTGCAWMPSLWADTECKREELSERFELWTRFHQKAFKELGFTECGFLKVTKSFNRLIRDTAGITYIGPSRSHFGQLLYSRINAPTSATEIDRIVIGFTAQLEARSLSITNGKNSFDPPDENEVIRIDSNDVDTLYRHFLERLQQVGESPRRFADIDAIRRWFDTRQIRAFEQRAERRLFIPMTEQEVEEQKRHSLRR